MRRLAAAEDKPFETLNVSEGSVEAIRQVRKQGRVLFEEWTLEDITRMTTFPSQCDVAFENQ